MTQQKLTQKQFLTWLYIARGLSDKEIAARLALSVNTLKYHKRAVFAFLGVRNRTVAAMMYVFGERVG